MSPGFLFESFPANTHGGQQMPSKLYVGNLAYSVTNDDLQALFSQVGKVASAAVVSDKFSGQSRGFGFVEMESSGDVAKAISEFDGKDLKGRNLKVNEAKPREFGGGGGGRDNRGGGGRAAPTAGRSDVGSAQARPFRFLVNRAGSERSLQAAPAQTRESVPVQTGKKRVR
jgi:RNA recognition motif-containing protein